MSSLTELLNSLQSHLRRQTSVLPALLAQLGLPLEDDLVTIHRILIDSIEAQIESRRKEVYSWMLQCETVENGCVLYSKLLGGHIKNTGNSVGELRKEKVLPHRHSLVSDHQEKLKQMYKTKLEQLRTLSNRLHALAGIIGHDFFTPDVLDDLDTSVNIDVTPERFLRMEKELARGKEEVFERLHLLSNTFSNIDFLYTELGIKPPSLDDLPASIFSASLSSSDFVTSTPTPASHNARREEVLEPDYRRIFANFVAKVEEAGDEEGERSGIPIGLEHVDPTLGLLKWAANLEASLEDTQGKREIYIQTVYDELEGLWRQLGIDEDDMDDFVDDHRGTTGQTIKEYEDELARMRGLKRERMSELIATAREEIVKLWKDLFVDHEERADFAPFADDHYTDELLAIHETELKKLKEEQQMKEPLLATIKKYFLICQEEQELANAASDQSRLTGRGARDPSRLLNEEKTRNRIMREKPRLEQYLLTALPAWEQDTGRFFLVYGESILEALVNTIEEENKRKAPPRARSVPPRSKTPCGGATRMPSDKRMKPDESTDRAPPARSHNGRSKIPELRSKWNAPSALPRAIPKPKPGTQHYALGHGRVPTGSGVLNGGVRSASAIKKASRARRESFRPRPSVDVKVNLGGSTRRRAGRVTASLRGEDDC